ncbi:serine hydrolase domain-containing protein [Acuticoccus kandeliae]|uniref:serine hydrolase domain-containing protein n=1 Tax=Acuticoccus kandeliae TaxID=2073160 RepID=UPI001B3B8C98|nr:serine hydrolase [Acuticoccus kandeliae]
MVLARLRVSAMLCVLLAAVPAMAADDAVPIDADPLAAVLDAAEALAPLETVSIAVEGEVIAERGYRDHRVTSPTNIKSASKAVLSALVGIAIDKGVLEGTDQPVAALLEADLPREPDPRMADVTVGHLLSMQAGLGSTSGPNYGAWVGSRNWVRAALARPFEADPGGPMIYSTGSSHLLSAILTRATGRSTLSLANEWLGPLEGFAIAGWDRDPQGIYMGGNQMAMSPRALLAFGELYRLGGVTPSGERLLSAEWIEESWARRTRSRFSGDGYGYGWFLRRIGGEDVRFAWGFGGQMLYIVPARGLTVAMTSDANMPSARTGHRDDLHRLLADIIAALPPAVAAEPDAAPDAASDAEGQEAALGAQEAAVRLAGDTPPAEAASEGL